MEKKYFLLFAAFFLVSSCFFASVATAQKAESNEVLTKVGNPIITSPPGGGTRPKAPPITGDARAAIIQKFGITMNGFNEQNLQWAWEKFWDVSNTRFIELAKGTIVTQTSGIPEQTGCKSLLINNSATQQRLNVILLHELGHVIYWCNPDSISGNTEQANIFAKEGGITGYGSSACFGTPPVNEDYAEMITYYLNPGVVEMVECNNRRQIPFADGKYPLHYDLARKILGVY